MISGLHWSAAAGRCQLDLKRMKTCRPPLSSGGYIRPVSISENRVYMKVVVSCLQGCLPYLFSNLQVSHLNKLPPRHQSSKLVLMKGVKGFDKVKGKSINQVYFLSLIWKKICHLPWKGISPTYFVCRTTCTTANTWTPVTEPGMSSQYSSNHG